MRELGGWSTTLVDFSRHIQSLGASLVPVIYADYELCSAPTPTQVIEVSEQISGATDRWSDERLESAQVSQVVEHAMGRSTQSTPRLDTSR